MKTIANEIFGIFEKFKEGKCTYDKALEDASKIMSDHSDKRPIIGYIKSGTLRDTLHEIVKNRKQNLEKPYTFNCEISHGIMDNAERMLKSM